MQLDLGFPFWGSLAVCFGPLGGKGGEVWFYFLRAVDVCGDPGFGSWRSSIIRAKGESFGLSVKGFCAFPS